jgi:hypothetical protein
MVRQLERPEVQGLHEGDTLEHEVRLLDETPLTVPEEWMREHGTTAQERRRPIRWMRWLAFLGVLAAGAGVVVLATLGDDNETVAQPEAVMVPQIRTIDRWELGLNPTLTPMVLRTVDNWELGLNPPTVMVARVPDAVAPAVLSARDFVAQTPEGQWISASPDVATPVNPTFAGWDGPIPLDG